jgi:hypothetical protein
MENKDMNKLNWQKFIKFWSQFYNDSQNLDEKLYYPYISDEGFLKKDDFLKNLWRWKMQVHYNNKSNQRALKLMEENKEIIRSFRNSRSSFDDLYNFSGKIFRSGIIYSIFLFHICKPSEYPIFDQHVFRAFTFIAKKEIIKDTKDIKNYWEYRDFVFCIHRKCKISLRDIDKGLMAFGQFLVNPSKILYGDKQK